MLESLNLGIGRYAAFKTVKARTGLGENFLIKKTEDVHLIRIVLRALMNEFESVEIVLPKTS